MYYDKIYFNFPIAIFRQVRERNGKIEGVEDAINDAIHYALYVEYQKRLPYRSRANELNEVVFDEVLTVMGVSVQVDRETYLRDLATSYKKYKNYRVFVGVDKTLLFNFRDDLDYKSDEDIIQLLAFLAIRSIIGAGQSNSRYKHIKWSYVLSRMAGHEKAVNNLDTLPKFISKYDSRRNHDKLINALRERWHLQYYGKYLGKGNAPLFSFSPNIDLVSIVENEKAHKNGVTGPIGNEIDVEQLEDVPVAQVEVMPHVPEIDLKIFGL